MDDSIIKLVIRKLKDSEILNITLDYGVHDKNANNYEIALIRWKEKGLIQISDTSATILEFQRCKSKHAGEWIKELEEKVARFPKLQPRRPALFGKVMFGESMFNDPGTKRNGKTIDDVMEEMKYTMFPDFDNLKDETRVNAHYDLIHIACHWIANRDIFLTNNVRHFKNILKDYPDLLITAPGQFVKLTASYFDHS